MGHLATKLEEKSRPGEPFEASYSEALKYGIPRIGHNHVTGWSYVVVFNGFRRITDFYFFKEFPGAAMFEAVEELRDTKGKRRYD